jgi:hypothetical protein
VAQQISTTPTTDRLQAAHDKFQAAVESIVTDDDWKTDASDRCLKPLG